jgi:hypothetical protein
VEDYDCVLRVFRMRFMNRDKASFIFSDASCILDFYIILFYKQSTITVRIDCWVKERNA